MVTKNFLVLAGILLAGTLISTFPNNAFADDNVQVWRDTGGQIVHNTWGMCVRSKWMVDQDPCAPPAPPPAPVAAKPTKHTVIAQKDRTVYFAFDKSLLTGESKTRLDTLADKLTAADDVTSVKIVGFADRIGTASYNEALSKKRAETVLSYLSDHGLIKPSVTETRWVGKSQPSTDCKKNLPRAELLQCLGPDRKVTVELVFSSTEMQPPK